MQLVGEQLEQLQRALLSAFYNWERLRGFFLAKMGLPLQQVSAEKKEQIAVINDVIEWVIGEGRLEEFVYKAKAYVPSNVALRAFAIEAALTPTSAVAPGSPFRRELEKAVLSAVKFYDAADQRARQARCERTVCRIELGNSGPWGTGFLLGPDIVLTNYHLIDDLDQETNTARLRDVTILFDYALGPDGRTPTTGTPCKLAIDGKWLLASSPESERDFALLRLDRPVGSEPAVDAPDATRGWLTPTPYPFSSAEPEPLFILQHPQVRENEPTDPLKITVGFVPPQAVGDRVIYTTNTLRGSSGSPCFRADWELVALHRAATTFDANEGIPFRAFLDDLRPWLPQTTTGKLTPNRPPTVDRGIQGVTPKGHDPASAELTDVLTQMPEPSEAVNRHMILVHTELADVAALQHRLGGGRFGKLIQTHDALFKEIIGGTPGARILRDNGNGFLATFPSNSGAVSACLRFQSEVRSLDDGPEPVRLRVGIHAGDVIEQGAVTGSSKPVGHAVDLTDRLKDLALPGQILLTRTVYDDAHNFVQQPTAAAGNFPPPQIQWVAHGPYQFEGNTDTVEVYEVGTVGIAPLRVPPDGPPARRNVAPADEATLGKNGWRPGRGVKVPQRENWELTEKLGEGGFGEVWLAEHRKTRQKQVFKFCFQAERLPGLRLETALFRLMKKTLGERPDIARIIDWQFDTPPYFLEAEYTPGGSLPDWAKQQGGIDRVPLATRLDIVAQVADALHAAHTVGVLHRDVKPSNILITADPSGEPHVVLSDFGIGRITDRDLFRREGITEPGMTVALKDTSHSGTRMYMAPELTITSPTPTTLSDIFALGVVLYQTVVGDLNRPRGDGWERNIDDEFLKEDIALCADGEPSRRLQSATDLAQRLRTLEDRRKARQAELAEQQRQAAARRAARQAEIDRQKHERARKVRRRRRMIGAGFLAAATIIGILLYSSWREGRLRREAEGAKTIAESLVGQLQDEQKKTNQLLVDKDWLAKVAQTRAVGFCVERGMRLADGNNLPDAVVWFAEGLRMDQDYPERAAAHRLRLGVGLGQCPHMTHAWFPGTKIDHAAFSPAGTHVVTVAGGAVQAWDVRSPGSEPVWQIANEMRVTRVAYSPDGGRLLTISADQVVRIWDARNGHPALTEPLSHSGVSCAAFDPMSLRIITAGKDGYARIWDVATGKRLYAINHRADAEGDRRRENNQLPLREEKPSIQMSDDTGRPAGINYAEFSPEGDWVVTAGNDGRVRFWSAGDGKPTGRIIDLAMPISDISAEYASLSRDQRLLLIGARRNANSWLVVWDLARHESVLTADIGLSVGESKASFSPIGPRVVVSPGEEGKVFGEVVESRRLVSSPRSLMPSALELKSAIEGSGSARLSDGSRPMPLAYEQNGDPERGIVARDRRAWSLIGRAEHRGSVNRAAFSPDACYFVTASDDGTARVWSAPSGRPAAPPLNHGARVTWAGFSPDGRWVLTVGEDGTARLWDLELRGYTDNADREFWHSRDLSLSSDGRRVLALDRDGSVWLRDAETDKPVMSRWKPGSGASQAWLSSEGRWVAAVTQDGQLLAWDAKSGSATAPLDWASARSLRKVLVLPDGSSLIGIDEFGTARAWQLAAVPPAPSNRGIVTNAPPSKVATGVTRLSTILQKAGRLKHATVSRDGTRLATVPTSGTCVQVWDLATGELAATVADSDAETAEFSASGHHLVTASRGQAAVWDAQTGVAVTPPLKHNQPVAQAALSPDGRYVVTACADGTARLWDAATGDVIAPLLRHSLPVTSAAFSHNGKRLITLTEQGVRSWVLEVDSSTTIDGLVRSVHLLSGNHFAETRVRLAPLDNAAFEQTWRARGGDTDALPKPAPGSAAWHWRRARDCEAAGQWSAAIWHLDQIIRVRPTSALLARRAAARRKLGDTDPTQLDRAIADYQQAGQLSPKDAYLAWDWADVYRQKGDSSRPRLATDRASTTDAYEQCRRRLDELPKDHPLTLALRRGLAESYYGLGDWLLTERAGDWLLDNWSSHDGRLKLAGFATLLVGTGVPGSVDILPWLVTSPSERPALAEAERCLQASAEILRGLPDATTVARRELRALARAFKRLGDAHEQFGRYEAARRAFLGSLQTPEGSARTSSADEEFHVYMHLGDASWKLNDSPAVIKYYRHAKEAADAWKKADPDSDSAKQNFGAACDKLASFYEARDQFGEAEALYRLVLANDEAWLAKEPDNARPKEMLTYSYLHMAKILRRRGDFAGAGATCNKYVQICEQLAKLDPAEEEAQRKLVSAHVDVAKIYEGIREPAISRLHWLKVLERCAKILAADSKNGSAKQMKGEALEWLCDVCLQCGSVGEARRYAQECVALAEELNNADPDSKSTKIRMVWGYFWLGQVSRISGQPALASDAYHRSFEICKVWNDAQPKDTAVKAEFAAVNWRMGTCSLASGDGAAARRLAMTAVSIRQEFVDGKPSEFNQELLASAYDVLGDACVALADVGAAGNAFHKALIIREDMVRQDGSAAHLKALALSLARIGRLEMNAGNFASAEPYFDRGAMILKALEDARKITIKRPDDSSHDFKLNAEVCKVAQHALNDIRYAHGQRRELAIELLIFRATMLTRRGDAEGAQATLEELTRLAPQDPEWDHFYSLARCYATLARATTLGRLKDQLSRDERARRDGFVLKAVEALDTAASEGFRDVVRLLQDSSFDIIRSEDGYRRLVERLDSRASR
jgi:WD40 repeat protein/class 3 adenylate cyclase/tetratricopeptide (TPR) repeat protein